MTHTGHGMHYPALIIDTKKIEHNTRFLADKCAEHGIEVAAVSKVFGGMPEVAQAMVNGGASMVADSRIENLKKLSHVHVPKMLLRIPMKSQADEVVEHADISLNSELDTLTAISEAAKRQKKVHKVVLMADLGDLREGVLGEHLIDFAGKAIAMKGIRVVGIGTNLTCYGGVIPDGKNLGELVRLARLIEKKYSITLGIVSGGNSSSLHLVFRHQMPKRINQLRLGESIALGVETAFGERIKGTYRDACTLALEIVEIKRKPSAPIGNIGMDAFGQRPVFEDKGNRMRGILAAGRQDIDIRGVIPRDKCISIFGGSSDHLLVDFTNCGRDYKVGDIVEFDLTYGGLLAACTSEYVSKVVLHH